MGNTCCDGGSKQPGQDVAEPGHVCAATNEQSQRYNSTKYTCQQRAAVKLMQAPAVGSCVADGQPCADGVDCCGVCAYKGADTMMCEACTPPGEECIPMGNTCCDGGSKQPGQDVAEPGHVCAATNEQSQRYNSTKYTCQQRAASIVPAPVGVHF